MASNNRNYTEPTKKRLAILSGNRCCNPDCGASLVSKDGSTVTGKICHIEAKSQGGPRYNPNMTDEERDDFNNLIFLCASCHDQIDNMANVAKYPVALLKSWKQKHESSILIEEISKKPSLLLEAISEIADIDIDDVASSNSVGCPYDITEKIEYNDIKINKPIISEYSKLYGKVNKIYDELEKQGSFKKSKLLSNIKAIYLKVKGKYVALHPHMSELEITKENSDKIYSEIERTLIESVESKKVYKEDVSLAIPIIMTDAFIKCKILEEPPSLRT